MNKMFMAAGLMLISAMACSQDKEPLQLEGYDCRSYTANICYPVDQGAFPLLTIPASLSDLQPPFVLYPDPDTPDPTAPLPDPDPVDPVEPTPPPVNSSPFPLDARQLYSGHSLTDDAAFQGRWPKHLRRMIDSLGVDENVDKSTIPGSNLRTRWNDSRTQDSVTGIGQYDLLVITEQVPLPSNRWGYDSGAELKQFVDNAWANNVETFLYATWSNRGDSFRSDLARDEARWEAMADAASADVPYQVRIIPANRLMMRLYDAGVHNDYFRDDIHLNGLGQYAVALMHLAVIHHVDPRSVGSAGLGLNPMPTAQQEGYIQDLVWDVVNNYERTGL